MYIIIFCIFMGSALLAGRQKNKHSSFFLSEGKKIIYFCTFAFPGSLLGNFCENQ